MCFSRSLAPAVPAIVPLLLGLLEVLNPGLPFLPHISHPHRLLQSHQLLGILQPPHCRKSTSKSHPASKTSPGTPTAASTGQETLLVATSLDHLLFQRLASSQTKLPSGSREMLIVPGSQRRSFGTEPGALTPHVWRSATLSTQTLKTLCCLGFDSCVTNTMCWEGQAGTGPW